MYHKDLNLKLNFFFYLGFSFTGQQAKGESIFNSSLPLQPTSRKITNCRVSTTGSWNLHIASDQSQTGNFWFPSAKPLSSVPFSLMKLPYLALLTVWMLQLNGAVMLTHKHQAGFTHILILSTACQNSSFLPVFLPNQDFL